MHEQIQSFSLFHISFVFCNENSVKIYYKDRFHIAWLCDSNLSKLVLTYCVIHLGSKNSFKESIYLNCFFSILMDSIVIHTAKRL